MIFVNVNILTSIPSLSFLIPDIYLSFEFDENKCSLKQCIAFPLYVPLDLKITLFWIHLNFIGLTGWKNFKTVRGYLSL